MVAKNQESLSYVDRLYGLNHKQCPKQSSGFLIPSQYRKLNRKILTPCMSQSVWFVYDKIGRERSRDREREQEREKDRDRDRDKDPEHLNIPLSILHISFNIY